MCDDVGEGDDEAAGPGVASTSGDRRPNTGTVGEDVPDRRGTLSERPGVSRAVMGGSQEMKTRRTPPVIPQTEDPFGRPRTYQNLDSGAIRVAPPRGVDLPCAPQDADGWSGRGERGQGRQRRGRRDGRSRGQETDQEPAPKRTERESGYDGGGGRERRKYDGTGRERRRESRSGWVWQGAQGGREGQQHRE